MLGETEKPVVSCYAFGEWRVSPDYFSAHHLLMQGPSPVSIVSKGTSSMLR